MRQVIRLALFVVVALLIGCQTSNTAFITATADPFVPAPEIPYETATALPTRAPTKVPLSVTVPPTMSPTSQAELPPMQGGPVPIGARLRLGIGGINQIAISPDKSILVVGTTVGLYGFQIATMERLWQVPVQAEVAGLSWMPFGDVIAVSYAASGLVTGLDADTGAELFVLEHTDNVGAVTWSPNGDRLAVAWGGNLGVDPSVGSVNARLTVWDIASLTRLFTSEIVNHKNYSESPSIGRLSWSRDGRLIAGASQVDDIEGDYTEEAAYIWDAQTGAVLHIMRANQMRLVQFLPTSDRLITWSLGCCGDAPRGSPDTLVWDVYSGQLLQTLTGEGRWVSDVNWLSDDSILITLTRGFDTADINSWNLLTGDRIQNQKLQDLELYTMDVSEDTTLAAIGGYSSATNDATVVVLDTATLTPVYEASQASQDISCLCNLAWGRDSVLVTASDELLRVHDVVRKTVLHELAGSNGYSGVHTVSWSADGNTITTRFSSSQLIWNTVDGSPMNNSEVDYDLFDESIIVSDVNSPNGELSASGSVESIGSFEAPSYKASVVVRDLKNNVLLKILEGPPAEVLHIAWSPDGTMLAAGGGLVGHFQGNPMVRGWVENTIYVWDTTTWELIRTYVGHTGRVNSLAFSPDSTQLASGSSDGTAIIWQVK